MYSHPTLWNSHPCIQHTPTVRVNNQSQKPYQNGGRTQKLSVFTHHIANGRDNPQKQWNPQQTLLTPPQTPTLPTPLPRSVPSIKKKLLFVRHAEAYHNSLYASGLKQNALQILDPQLTPVGHNQVSTVNSNIL